MKPLPFIGLLFACVLAGCAAAPKHTEASSKSGKGDEGKDAMGLFFENRDAMYALKAYRAVCFTEVRQDLPGTKGSQHLLEVSCLTAQKPDRIRYDWWMVNALPNPAHFERPAAPPTGTVACDGKVQYEQVGKRYRINRDTDEATRDQLTEQWRGIFSKSNSVVGAILKHDASESFDVSYVGTDEVDGVPCEIAQVRETVKGQAHAEQSVGTYYLGRDDHLTRRVVWQEFVDGKLASTSDAVIHNIELSPKVDPSIYKYTPPAGVKLQESPEPVKFLAQGTLAPAFTAVDALKHRVSLSDFRGKVVLIDFWASWCGPCKASMPHTNDVVKRLAAAGVPVVGLAVDDGEEFSKFSSWVSDNGSQYPNLKFVHSDPARAMSHMLFGINSIPAQFVLDRKGIVRASFVGYRGPTDDLEKAIRAAAGK